MIFSTELATFSLNSIAIQSNKESSNCLYEYEVKEFPYSGQLIRNEENGENFLSRKTLFFFF